MRCAKDCNRLTETRLVSFCGECFKPKLWSLQDPSPFPCQCLEPSLLPARQRSRFWDFCLSFARFGISSEARKLRPSTAPRSCQSQPKYKMATSELRNGVVIIGLFRDSFV